MLLLLLMLPLPLLALLAQVSLPLLPLFRCWHCIMQTAIGRLQHTIPRGSDCAPWIITQRDGWQWCSLCSKWLSDPAAHLGSGTHMDRSDSAFERDWYGPDRRVVRHANGTCIVMLQDGRAVDYADHSVTVSHVVGLAPLLVDPAPGLDPAVGPAGPAAGPAPAPPPLPPLEARLGDLEQRFNTLTAGQIPQPELQALEDRLADRLNVRLTRFPDQWVRGAVQSVQDEVSTVQGDLRDCQGRIAIIEEITQPGLVALHTRIDGLDIDALLARVEMLERAVSELRDAAPPSSSASGSWGITDGDGAIEGES